MKGIITDILHCSLNDGDGVRVTVFLKGCPLRCEWCHNPETQNAFTELLYNTSLCAGCRACEGVCKNGAVKDGVFDRSKCVKCFECVKVCTSGARKNVGREMTDTRVIDEVCRDKMYWSASGGGMTVSGGEPFFQPEFTLSVLKKAKERNINTCVETCGFCKTSDILAAVPYTDCFYFDFKEADAVKHKEFTGASNEIILENLSALDSAGAKIVLTCPVIPMYNLSEAHFKAIAELAYKYKSIEKIKLQPYHPLGADKAAQLGKAYLPSLAYPTAEEKKKWKEMLEGELSKLGLNIKTE